MSMINPKEKYEQLFSDKAKAKAFDKIAENYYFCNFGTMRKADLDILMFSLYIDRILNISEEDINSYSDYILSKYLGITQSKVSNLKVSKELKYPYEGFDWHKSFFRLCENIRYEKGKIKLDIRDKNLYYEIKNAIEVKGGYIDVQLNSNLLCVSPEYFIDLILDISEDDDARKKVREQIKKECEKNNIDTEYFEQKNIGDILKDNGILMLCKILESTVPVVGNIKLSNVIKMVINVMRK